MEEKNQAQEEQSRLPLIGDPAPSFKAKTTMGPINFPEDYKGKWVILFSHPADFTPVCTTEFMTFATMQEDFRKLNTELIGLSIDSIYAHIAWLRTIKDDVIVPPPGSCGTARDRVESKDDDQYCLDWFMCFRIEYSLGGVSIFAEPKLFLSGFDQLKFNAGVRFYL